LDRTEISAVLEKRLDFLFDIVDMLTFPKIWNVNNVNVLKKDC
jgi:hypothetical protein